MKKYVVALVIFATVMVMIVGSRYAKEKTALSSTVLEPLSIGLAMQPGSGLVMIALEKGFFKEEGLAVEVKPYPSGKRALEEGLFESKLDMITTADTPVVFAVFERSDYKVIATLCEADSIYRIVANKKMGITRPEDLMGKRLTTQPKSSTHFFLSLFLLEHGLKMSDVNLTFSKSETQPKALVDGSVDAVSLREPFSSQVQKMLGSDAVVFSSPGLYTQMELAVARDTLIREHPESVEKFLRGVLRAETYMKEHPQEGIKLIKEYLDTPHLGVTQNQYQIGLGQSLVALMDDQGRWVISEQLVPSDEIPDFITVIDDRWLKKLKPQSVTIIH